MANKTYPELPTITSEDDGDLFPTWTVNASGLNPETQTRAELRASMNSGVGLMSLDSAYQNGSAVNFNSLEPITLILPDSSTQRFLTQNVANGFNGSFIWYDNYQAKDNIGGSQSFGFDSLIYRQNFDNTNVQSSQRTFSVAVNSLVIDYLRLDGGGRQIIAGADILSEGKITINKQGTVPPELDFSFQANGSVGLTTVDIKSLSKSSTGDDKTLNLLTVTTVDPLSASFSQSLNLQAYRNNAIVDAFQFDGTDGSTKLINFGTGLPDQAATLLDIPATSTPTFQTIYNLPSKSFTIDNGNFNINSSFGSFVTFYDEFESGEADPTLLVRGKILGRDKIDVESANLTPTFSAYKNIASIGSNDLINISAYANNSLAVKTLFYKQFVRAVSAVSGSETTGVESFALINGSLATLMYQSGNQTLIRNKDSGNFTQVLTTEDVPASVARPVFTLSNGTVPTQNYPSGVWTSVLTAESGSRVIAANSLEIGSSVEISITGIINSILSGGSGQIRCMFAGLVMATSRVVNVVGPTGARNWNLTYKLTRISATEYNTSAYGTYEDYSDNEKNLQIRILGLPKNASFALANTIDVECLSTTAPGNTLDFIATNFNLIQMT